MKSIKIAPGAFDGIPEEDQKEIFEEIERMLEDGTLFENSVEVDLDALMEEDPELYAKLMGDTPTLQ